MVYLKTEELLDFGKSRSAKPSRRTRPEEAGSSHEEFESLSGPLEHFLSTDSGRAPQSLGHPNPTTGCQT